MDKLGRIYEGIGCDRYREDDGMNLKYRRENGFSLIEIPVALLVLAIVFAIAARTFKTAGHVRSDARYANRAAVIASNKISELQSLPASSIVGGTDQVVDVNGLTFDRKWSVSQPIAGANAKEVDIVVQWEINQKSDSIELATLLR
jgi:prepilin-type N-terminal cleavage/methylation domain-containing protein